MEDHKFAFPQMISVGEVGKSEGGLTKREYFAGLAMQGFVSTGAHYNADIAAEAAVEYADALIAELEKNEET